MGITDILRRICLFSASEIKSFESFSKQPTQGIAKLNSSLQHIIVTKNDTSEIISPNYVLPVVLYLIFYCILQKMILHRSFSKYGITSFGIKFGSRTDLLQTFGSFGLNFGFNLYQQILPNFRHNQKEYKTTSNQASA